MLHALNWLTDLRVDVINISIGGSYNSLIAHAVKQAHNADVLIVASAGNSGPFTKRKNYPGAYEQTIAIAASDRVGSTAKFSSAGKYVEFTAPGVKIWTAIPGGGKAMSGTSFSSPIVASYVAAARKLKGVKNLAGARRYLRAHLTDPNRNSWNKYNGWGIVSVKPPC